MDLCFLCLSVFPIKKKNRDSMIPLGITWFVMWKKQHWAQHSLKRVFCFKQEQKVIDVYRKNTRKRLKNGPTRTCCKNAMKLCITRNMPKKTALFVIRLLFHYWLLPYIWLQHLLTKKAEKCLKQIFFFFLLKTLF